MEIGSLYVESSTANVAVGNFLEGFYLSDGRSPGRYQESLAHQHREHDRDRHRLERCARPKWHGHLKMVDENGDVTEEVLWLL